MIDSLAFAGAAACLVRIAVVDARRFVVDLRAVAALAAIAAAWRFLEGGSFAAAALGALLGLGFAAVPIAAAELRGRRWPVMPGDGLLLGACGLLLGPLDLAWATAAGCLFAFAQRACVQRRRGRPVAAGYCPFGPGLAAGAGLVFAAALSGAPLAQGIAATEIRTPPPALPAELAGREVSLSVSDPVPFPELARRVSEAAGVPVAIEERPARIAGGAAAPPDPPPASLSFEGALPDLLRRAAALSGYDWTWTGGAIVFHRYRDAGRRAPRPANPAAWTVDADRPLRAALEAWAERAGWRIVWRAAGRYSIDASASFDGPGFLAAVDALLADAPRQLTATAHPANRHLVIDDR